MQDSLGGTVTRSYDGLDRLLSETTPQGTVSYTYDAAGRRTTMAVPGQAQVAYAYDNADRLTSITQGAATTTFGYDDANRRTTMTLPNGVVASYAYNDASQLLGITYQQGSTALGTLTYAYDLAERISSRGGTLFQSVLPAAVTSATYDIASRMTARTAAGVTTSPIWDLNGSLTSDGLRSYTWDARNRLTAITGVAAYAYDGLDRRQSSTLGAAPARSYLYDGFDVVQEQIASSPSANVLTGAGVDERLTRTPATGATLEQRAPSSPTPSAPPSHSSTPPARSRPATDMTPTAPQAPRAPQATAPTSNGRENDGPASTTTVPDTTAQPGAGSSPKTPSDRGGINRYTYADGNPALFQRPERKLGAGHNPFPPLGAATDYPRILLPGWSLHTSNQARKLSTAARPRSRPLHRPLRALLDTSSEG